MKGGVQRGPRPRLVWLKPMLLNQKTHSVLGLLPLITLKIWLHRSFPGPEKGTALPTGQREGFKAYWLRGAPRASQGVSQMSTVRTWFPNGSRRPGLLSWGLRCVSSLLCPVPGSSSLRLRSQDPAWTESLWQMQAPLWNAVLKRLLRGLHGLAETHAFLSTLLPLEEGSWNGRNH